MITTPKKAMRVVMVHSFSKFVLRVTGVWCRGVENGRAVFGR